MRKRTNLGQQRPFQLFFFILFPVSSKLNDRCNTQTEVEFLLPSDIITYNNVTYISFPTSLLNPPTPLHFMLVKNFSPRGKKTPNLILIITLKWRLWGVLGKVGLAGLLIGRVKSLVRKPWVRPGEPQGDQRTQSQRQTMASTRSHRLPYFRGQVSLRLALYR